MSANARRGASKPPARHEFLSPGWIEAVTRIRDEYHGRVPTPPIAVRANVVVTGAPFENPDVHGSLDTSDGQVRIEPGHVDRPDFTATLDYATAKALFGGDDPSAVLQAFFGGKIRITGDASKVLVLQATLAPPKPGSPEAALAGEIAQRVRDVTR